MLDALKETGGVWFGWNGEIAGAPEEPVIERTQRDLCDRRPDPRDYDQYIAASRMPRCGRYFTIAAISRASIARNMQAICA
ncbi:hypothetical protein BMMON2_34480 [Burkholderia mallei]